MQHSADGDAAVMCGCERKRPSVIEPSDAANPHEVDGVMRGVMVGGPMVVLLRTHLGELRPMMMGIDGRVLREVLS